MELNNIGLGVMPPGQGTQYRTKPGFALREVCGEWLTIPVALAPEEASRMAVLNEEGKFLWEKLQEFVTVDDLVTAMTEEYDVSPGQAREDILDFLRVMDQHALLLIKSEVEL